MPSSVLLPAVKHCSAQHSCSAVVPDFKAAPLLVSFFIQPLVEWHPHPGLWSQMRACQCYKLSQRLSPASALIVDHPSPTRSVAPAGRKSLLAAAAARRCAAPLRPPHSACGSRRGKPPGYRVALRSRSRLRRRRHPRGPPSARRAAGTAAVLRASPAARPASPAGTAPAASVN